MRYTFTKQERLSKKKWIDELFQNGSSFSFYPFRVIVLIKEFENPFPSQVLISVSSKNFSRAVDRNKVKRLMREGYRLHKHALYNGLNKKNKSLLLAFLYQSKTIEPYLVIEEKMKAALHKISAEL